MAESVYLICAGLSILCTFMLFRGYANTGTKLLLWTAVSFALMALNNIFLFVDLALLPELNLNGPFWRNILGAASGSVMLCGLIWELT
jgi:hypothetical protein